MNNRLSMSSSSTTNYRSGSTSPDSSYTHATSLPPLQHKGLNGHDLEPLNEEDIDPGSFDLVAPPEGGQNEYSLERRSEQLFGKEHLQIIFGDPSLLAKFSSFLSANRPASLPILVYYLDSLKALKVCRHILRFVR